MNEGIQGATSEEVPIAAATRWRPALLQRHTLGIVCELPITNQLFGWAHPTIPTRDLSLRREAQGNKGYFAVLLKFRLHCCRIECVLSPSRRNGAGVIRRQIADLGTRVFDGGNRHDELWRPIRDGRPVHRRPVPPQPARSARSGIRAHDKANRNGPLEAGGYDAKSQSQKAYGSHGAGLMAIMERRQNLASDVRQLTLDASCRSFAAPIAERLTFRVRVANHPRSSTNQLLALRPGTVVKRRVSDALVPHLGAESPPTNQPGRKRGVGRSLGQALAMLNPVSRLWLHQS